MIKTCRIAYTLFAMARPPQLVAVTLVFAWGVVIALANGAQIELHTLAWSYTALILVAMSIHYANEYADFETDALTRRTLYSGGSGALQKTGLPRGIAVIAAWCSLGVGIGLAVFARQQAMLSWSAIGVLAFGAFFGWMYSLRPLALAWRGWGELDNAALGGVVLPLYGYTVVAGRFDWFVILAALPFGMLVFINLLATTWPDRKADGIVGKRTLATRWTTPRLRLLYWGVAASTFLLLPLLSGWILPPVVVWSCLLVIPVVLWGAIAYTRARSPFPTVAAMMLMLALHLMAWWSTIGFALPIN